MRKRKSIENMTDDKVLDVNFFEEDLAEMYEDADKLSQLADKIEKDMDEIYFNKNSRELIGRGTLPYIANQMKNMSEIRTAKATTTNQIITAKLKISQLALQKRKNNEGDGNGASAADIAREFQKLFMENKDMNATPIVQQEQAVKMAESHNDENVAFEERLKSLSESGEIKFSDNEQVIKYEKRGVEFRVSKSIPHHFMAYATDDGSPLPDYPQTLFPQDNLDNATFSDTECKLGATIYKLF